MRGSLTIAALASLFCAGILHCGEARAGGLRSHERNETAPAPRLESGQPQKGIPTDGASPADLPRALRPRSIAIVAAPLFSTPVTLTGARELLFRSGLSPPASFASA